jgi:hypothetical protein
LSEEKQEEKKERIKEAENHDDHESLEMGYY